jgi:hypothetical protein
VQAHLLALDEPLWNEFPKSLLPRGEVKQIDCLTGRRKCQIDCQFRRSAHAETPSPFRHHPFTTCGALIRTFSASCYQRLIETPRPEAVFGSVFLPERPRDLRFPYVLLLDFPQCSSTSTFGHRTEDLIAHHLLRVFQGGVQVSGDIGAPATELRHQGVAVR